MSYPPRYLIREAIAREYGDQPPAPKTPAVWAAASLEKAIALRDRLLVSFGRHANPFRFVFATDKLANATTLSENQFRHRLRQIGVEPPRDANWERWYSDIVRRLDDARLLAVWKLFDKVEPYKIDEPKDRVGSDLPSAVPRLKTAYVVVQMYWQYNDNWHDLGDEEPVKAFLDRDAAEVLRLQLEEPERVKWGTPFFAHRVVENLTSLPLDQLLQAIGDAAAEQGILPPKELFDEIWWGGFIKRASLKIFHRVWDLFDRVRFYQTVEVEVAEPHSSSR